MDASVPIAASRHRFPLSAVMAFGKDPIGFLGELAAQGPLAGTSLAGEKVILVSEPELIREVMLTRSGELIKSRPFPRVKLLLGDGLFTLEGDEHRAHRRMVMPAFHRQAIGHHGALLVERAAALRDSWRDGQEVSLHAALSELSLDMAARALYGADLGPAIGRIQRAMGTLMGHFAISTPPWLDRIKLRLPLASTRETEAAVAEMDAVLAEVLDRRRAAAPGSHQDLLQMLMDARDEDGRSLNAKRAARRSHDPAAGQPRHHGHGADLDPGPAGAEPGGAGQPA
jgi:cytochrome P450